SPPGLRGGPHDLDQRRSSLSRLHPQEGQSAPAGTRHVAVADAVPANRASSASQRAAVSPELPARELARLPLLGHRARAVSTVGWAKARFFGAPCPRGLPHSKTAWAKSPARPSKRQPWWAILPTLQQCLRTSLIVSPARANRPGPARRG